MRSHYGVILALACWLAPAAALAWTHGSGGGGGFSGGVSGGTANCPYNTVATDGCAGANTSSTFAQANYYQSYAAQSGQSYTYTFTGSITSSSLTVTGGTTPKVGDTITGSTGGVSLPAGVFVVSGSGPYTLSGSGATMPSGTFTGIHRPATNMPCVDYKCGIYTSIASHTDPANFVTANGCAYTASGGLIGPRIQCTLTANETISHLNLSGDAISGFGHACTSIIVHNPTAFNLILDDVYFENDPACLNSETGSGNPVLINYGGAASSGNATLTNSTFIGHGADLNGWCPGNGASVCVANAKGTLPQVFSATTSGSMTMEYNRFDRWPGHTFGMAGTGTCPTTGTELVAYNYQDSNHLRVPMGHGAFGSFGCALTQSYDYNALLWSNAGGTLETTLTTMLSGSPNGSAVGTWNVLNNSIISNLVGGTSRTTFSGTYHLDGTTGALTIDTTAGTILPGMSVAGAGQFTDVYLWQEITGSGGVGSTWSYDCGENTVSATGVCNPATTGQAYYDVVQTPTFISTNSLGGAGASGSVTFSPQLTSTTPVGLVHGAFTQVNVENNLIDNSGGPTAVDGDVFDASSGTCANPSVISGNINLLTGAAANGATGIGATGC